MVATAQPIPAATAPPAGPPAPPTAIGDDPWESADKAQWNPTIAIFGEVQIDLYYCILQQGVGKVRFDPNLHDVADRRTAITITIIPVIPGRRTFERNIIAEGGEWTKIVNPSIKALGPTWTLKALHGRYVEAHLVDNTFDKKRDDGTFWKTLTIKHVFDSEDACVAAAQVGHASQANAAPAPAAAAPSAPAAPNEHEKGVALKLLPALWNGCNGDVAKFVALLGKNGLTARYFTLESPEVMALIMPADTTT